VLPGEVAGRAKAGRPPRRLGGDRRQDAARRKAVAEMTPEELKRELLTSQVVDLPNRRAFEEAGPAKAVGYSDADALKALNDTYGYAAGDQLLRAKAEALKEAGLDAYHEKGDEFLYRGGSEGEMRAKLEAAREILREKHITVRMKDGTERTFKGADFSYGTGHDLAAAEAGLKRAQGRAGRPAASGPVGSFEDLLRLDPAQVASISVEPHAATMARLRDQNHARASRAAEPGRKFLQAQLKERALRAVSRIGRRPGSAA
jgi:GGDEF domain-containing protein